MKIRFSTVTAVLVLAAPLATSATAATSHYEAAQVFRVADEATAAKKQSPAVPPRPTAGQSSGAVGPSWIESRMAREWWKDD